jgi:predicted nuclease with TOPRIM domain
MKEQDIERLRGYLLGKDQQLRSAIQEIEKYKSEVSKLKSKVMDLEDEVAIQSEEIKDQSEDTVRLSDTECYEQGYNCAQRHIPLNMNSRGSLT